MKVALAQVNCTVGDLDGNVRRVLGFARRARDLGADLCLFPEQCLPGYPAHDLLERPGFIRRNWEALQQVAAEAPDIGLVVGWAERGTHKWGKRLFNSAALIFGGQVASVHRKCLLPTYDIFDERRYFDPGGAVTVAEFGGVRLGITICEDIWNDPDFWREPLYDRDPVRELVEAGAEVILNIAASPFTLQKRHLRREMLSAAARDYRRPLLFCNMVGGNDDLVFDGASSAFGPDGRQWAQGKEFEEDLVLVDLDLGAGDVRGMLPTDEDAALEALTMGTRDYAHKCGFSSALLGLSGGVDSALVAVVAVRALGTENLEVVLMPSRFTRPSSVEDALQLAKNLGVRHRIISIDGVFQTFLDELTPAWAGRATDTTEENLQARIRGTVLMALSNKFGHLLLSTGNKSEMATGYCTLYGDMAGGLAVISDVPKTLVYRLCEVVNREREIIPRRILTKAPSAELKENQTDQDTLPPYDLLDRILEEHIVGGKDRGELVRAGYEEELVGRVLDMVRNSEYKRRQAPPGLKITSKAFGHGRRMPLAQRWRD